MKQTIKRLFDYMNDLNTPSTITESKVLRFIDKSDFDLLMRVGKIKKKQGRIFVRDLIYTIKFNEWML